MKKPKPKALQNFEKAIKKNKTEKFVLRLYVSGTSPQSQRALFSIRKICEEHLHGRYQLQVIDIYQNSELAKKDHVIAVPTLVKSAPVPLKRLIGDMSDETKVLAGLGILKGGRA